MARLGIIFGGRSGEHEVSLMSATSVINALSGGKFDLALIGITRRGEWKLYSGPVRDVESGEWEKTAAALNPGDLKNVMDFAFPVLHGPYGEDGTIQGMFEMLDIPYAGCGVLASSLAMDKIIAKDIFTQYGLPVCKYKAVMAESLEGGSERPADEIERCLGGKYPLFVKPANLGSSVGISKVKDRRSLIKALREAAEHDRRLIVEEFIDGRELETAVLGNAEAEAAAVGEILPSEEFYSYNAKYFDGGKTRISVPADVGAEVSGQIMETAVKAYKAIDGAGFARVDFFLENVTGKVYLSEINTIPGFTKYSMFPRLCRSAGMTYPGLLERIVELGYERYNAKNNRQTAI